MDSRTSSSRLSCIVKSNADFGGLIGVLKNAIILKYVLYERQNSLFTVIVCDATFRSISLWR